jgi:hypothetical protein
MAHSVQRSHHKRKLQSIGLNLQPFTGNGDIQISLKYYQQDIDENQTEYQSNDLS